MPVAQLASKVVDAKKLKEDSISLSALTLLGNPVYEFSKKRREMLKSEFAPAYKMLFGDELPQSIRNISQVKRMAAKSVGHDRSKASSSSSAFPNFKKPRINTSGYHRFGSYGRSNLNFKCHYEYRKLPYQKSQSTPTRHPPKSSSKIYRVCARDVIKFSNPKLKSH